MGLEYKQMKDTLYSQHQTQTGQTAPTIAPFEFNQEVVQVFADMIQRSVPGYGMSIELSVVLAAQFCKAGAHIYDLGCSLGACSLAIAHHSAVPPLSITAVDISIPMLKDLQKTVTSLYPNAVMTQKNPDTELLVQYKDILQRHSLKLEHADITSYTFQPCDLVLLNYVLQFIELSQREALLTAIFSALKPGAALLLSEKIELELPDDHQLIDKLHLGFKSLQGYSELEIHSKRTALENVLTPEKLQTHLARLKQIGFKQVITLGYHLNFVNILAIK